MKLYDHLKNCFEKESANLKMAWSLLLLNVRELALPVEKLSCWEGAWPLVGGVRVDLLGEGPPLRVRSKSDVKFPWGGGVGGGGMKY